MGLFDFLNPIKLAIQHFLISLGVTVPPNAGVFMLFISFIVSGISGLVTRAVIDLDKIQKESEEMAEHQKRKKKAMETADKRLWKQVQKNEDRFNQLQKSTMMARMLPSIITFGPIIFVFTTLSETFQYVTNLSLNGNPACKSSCGGLIILPFKVSKAIPIFGNWFSPFANDASLSIAGFGFCYFLSAIVISTLIQRLFGINLTGMQNPGMQMPR